VVTLQLVEKLKTHKLPLCVFEYIIKNMPNVACKKCGGEFYSKPSWVKKGKGKYCSIQCSSQTRRRGKIVKCSICRRKIYKSLKAIHKTKSGKLFCSFACSVVWRNSRFYGNSHPNWKHGEYSYKNTMKRSGVPKICILCGTKNKKVIIVHHIDKNRKNNKLKNLSWLCRNCHFLVHHYSEENDRLLVRT